MPRVIAAAVANTGWTLLQKRLHVGNRKGIRHDISLPQPLYREPERLVSNGSCHGASRRRTVVANMLRRKGVISNTSYTCLTNAVSMQFAKHLDDLSTRKGLSVSGRRLNQFQDEYMRISYAVNFRLFSLAFKLLLLRYQQPRPG